MDLEAQYSSIKEEIDGAIAQVLRHTQFINGPEVAEFEGEFARLCSAEYAVGTGNGTDALRLALQALEIGPGDDVVTTTNTFIATAEAISSVGATPVFVDVDPDHYNMTGAVFEAAITSKTRAVIPVHMYGQPAPMDEIMETASRYGIRVIEDAAQAHGAEYAGRRLGGWGDIGCFSFYPAKNLGAYGDAGAVVTSDEALADSVRMLRDHGRTDKYIHEFIGSNSRLDTLQAAILRVKLRHLERWNRRRRIVAEMYSASLGEFSRIKLPKEIAGGCHVYHLYVIQTDRRDALRQHLSEHGIGTGIHYPVPLHLQPAYRDLGYGNGDFPVAEHVADRILSLPMYPELSDEAVAETVASVATFHGES